MTAPLWRRRAVLLSGLGLAAASLSSQVRLSRQRQADATASTPSTQKGSHHNRALRRLNRAQRGRCAWDGLHGLMLK